MIHSCSYYCHKPECIKAQRDELRDKLYKREWVGLTTNEIALINADYPNPQGFARAVEAKLKEKNT